jgi:hypothetical protein
MTSSRLATLGVLSVVLNSPLDCAARSSARSRSGAERYCQLPPSIVRYMRHNRSVPPATVVPILVYPDVRAAVTWLTTTFGFVERTRIGDSHRVQMSIGTDGAVIVADLGFPRNRGGFGYAASGWRAAAS